MPPVRVKVYGLFGMTRRTYLVMQVLTLLVGLAAIAVGLWWPRPKLTANPTPRQLFFRFLLELLPWAALVGLLLGVVETWLILRRFARKQAEADQAALPPTS